MIYRNIVSLCEERHISIAQLEREAGLGNATIRTWEKSDPGAKKLKRVAEYLGVTVDSLLSNTPAANNTKHESEDSSVAVS